MTLCYDVFFGQPEVDSCVLKVSVFLWLEPAPQVSTTVIICRIECQLNANLCWIGTASFQTSKLPCQELWADCVPMYILTNKQPLYHFDQFGWGV